MWSTVTPFVFDRYPKEPFGDEAERTVREAMMRVGLPEPCEIDLHYNPWHPGVPKASAFPPATARKAGQTGQRYHCHARVRFGRLVAGPSDRAGVQDDITAMGCSELYSMGIRNDVR